MFALPKNSEMVGSGLEPASPGSEASTQPTEPPNHPEIFLQRARTGNLTHTIEIRGIKDLLSYSATLSLHKAPQTLYHNQYTVNENSFLQFNTPMQNYTILSFRIHSNTPILHTAQKSRAQKPSMITPKPPIGTRTLCR